MAGCTNNSQQTSDEIGGSEGAIAPGLATAFPNGKSTLQFDEFIEMIRESCSNEESAENYLVFAFSMFDRKR
jgi:Ca2+-binding EF-hand superfamily protein